MNEIIDLWLAQWAGQEGFQECPAISFAGLKAQARERIEGRKRGRHASGRIPDHLYLYLRNTSLFVFVCVSVDFQPVSVGSRHGYSFTIFFFLPRGKRECPGKSLQSDY